MLGSFAMAPCPERGRRDEEILTPNQLKQLRHHWRECGNDHNNDEFVIGHLGLWKKVQNIRRDPRVALSMLGPNTNAQGLRESLVVYGSARITEGGAPILLQRLAHIYIGPDCEFPPSGLHVKPGYITHVAPAQMRGIGPWIESGR